MSAEIAIALTLVMAVVFAATHALTRIPVWVFLVAGVVIGAFIGSQVS